MSNAIKQHIAGTKNRIRVDIASPFLAISLTERDLQSSLQPLSGKYTYLLQDQTNIAEVFPTRIK